MHTRTRTHTTHYKSICDTRDWQINKWKDGDIYIRIDRLMDGWIACLCLSDCARWMRVCVCVCDHARTCGYMCVYIFLNFCVCVCVYFSFLRVCVCERANVFSCKHGRATQGWPQAINQRWRRENLLTAGHPFPARSSTGLEIEVTLADPRCLSQNCPARD